MLVELIVQGEWMLHAVSNGGTAVAEEAPEVSSGPQ
jgi:hypothetical protein